ncbi:MAG: hypothetical protein LBH98_10585 [Chitinispirillales bacterium]|jgi:hypothetical protein|nr:hypothetical protein [Chitinispirillales bacterium]
MRCFFESVIFVFIFLFLNCSLPPYSQDKIIKKSKQILADSGDYYLEKWLVREKRVSLDTLVKICAPNIGQYDSVRNALFTCLSEITDTTILKLMGVKVISGNPIEKLTASAYIYKYYGVKMTLSQDVPLASSLLLFNSTANNLSKISNSQIYANVEQRSEIAKTFPQTENLYREFILNQELSPNVRIWFVRSLLEHDDREMVMTFLLGIEAELSKNDSVYEFIEETIYAIMNRGTKGAWIVSD